MNTPDYANKLNDIKLRIGQYTQNNKKHSFTTNNILIPKSGFTTKLPNVSYNLLLFYIVPHIFTFIILLIWNPRFVTKEVTNKNNIVSRKRNFKTILIMSIIIGIIIDISMFAYLKRN